MGAGVMIIKFARWIKRQLRFLINLVKKRRLKNLLILSNNFKKSQYNFTTKDVHLFVTESFAPLPKMELGVIEDCPGIITVKINNHSIFWPSNMGSQDLPWLYHEVFDCFDINPSSYDNPIIDFQAKDWIIDAGAAEGFFSIFALQRSSAKIYVMEPLQPIQESLRKTLCNYASPDRFELLATGLGKSSGLAHMEINQAHLCDSKIIENPSLIDRNNLQKINIISLDDIALKYPLSSRGLVKMDIEGYEMEALKGASWMLNNLKPALAIAVYHGIDNARLCSEIIKAANPSYTIEYRGYYGFFDPPRPYILFAY